MHTFYRLVQGKQEILHCNIRHSLNKGITKKNKTWQLLVFLTAAKANCMEWAGVSNKSKIILTKEWQIWFNRTHCLALPGIPLNLMS